MADQQGEFDVITSGGTTVALTSTGDKLVLPALPFPIDVVEWGAILTTGFDATLRTLALDLRPTAGSDSNRAEMDTISGSAAVAAGVGLYSRPSPPIEVDAGEQLVIECTDAAVAGAANLYVKFRKRPATGARFTTKMTEA